MSTPSLSAAEPREFRVTFGQRHPREEHPTFPAADKDGWLAVLAWDYREAYEALAGALGNEWCNFYAPHYATYPQVKWYPKGELGFLDATVSAGQQVVTQRNSPAASALAEEKIR
jgi:hypothetical protein